MAGYEWSYGERQRVINSKIIKERLEGKRDIISENVMDSGREWWDIISEYE